MKQRALEILFRRWILLLLPFVVIVPATAYLAIRPAARQFQSWANVLVEQPTQLYQDPRLGYTPAPAQATLLNDFLHTQAFASAVIAQTRLAPLLQTPAGQIRAIRLVQRSVQTTSTSNNFINVAATMPDPDLALETVQAVVNLYSAQLAQDAQDQATKTIALYGDNVAAAQAALTQAQNQLASYIANHPALGAAQQDQVSAAQRDPQFAQLVNQLQSAQQSMDALQQKYLTAQQTDAAAQQGLPFTFQLVDPPQRPTSALVQSRVGLVKLPAIGLVVASVMSAAVAVWLVLGDRRVLGEFDVAGIEGVPVLGEIPRLRGPRVPLWRPARGRGAHWWSVRRRSRHVVRLRVSSPANARSLEVRGL